MTFSLSRTLFKKALRPNNECRGKRRFFFSFSIVSQLAPRCVIVTSTRDCNVTGTYLHNVALPISRTHTCRENDLPTRGMAKAISQDITIRCEIIVSPVFIISGSRNHRAAVLNSILHNRFVVRWFSRPARYAWLLGRWNCRYYTSFFFFKATLVAAGEAVLPTVCRLPVVPDCLCVRFWRIITGLN